MSATVLALVLAVSGLLRAALPHRERPATPPVRSEYFLVERPATVEDGEPTPVAAVALRRSEVFGGLLLERDVQFREGGARVLLDELGGSRLVWRELRTSPEVGRTWMAEWDPASATLRTRRWGTRSGDRRERPTEPELVFPLALVERLRTDARPADIVVTLDPLGEAVVELALAVFPADVRDAVPLAAAARRICPAVIGRLLPQAAGPRVAALRTCAAWIVPLAEWSAGGERTVTLSRSDGSLAVRYVFRGESLVAFQWQAGPAWARRVDEDLYHRRAEAWRVEHDPLAELRSAVRAGRVLRR